METVLALQMLEVDVAENGYALSCTSSWMGCCPAISDTAML